MCGPTRPAPPRLEPATDFEELRLAEDLGVLVWPGTRWPSPGNVVYVLDDDGVSLIDCGLGTEESIVALDRALRKLGRQLDAVHTVISTHPHVDHAGGIRFLEHDVRVQVPATTVPRFRNPQLVAESILPGVVRELDAGLEGYDEERHFRHFRRDCGATALDHPLEEIEPGETVEAGRRRFEALATPGHDHGMLSFVEPEEAVIVCSDLLAAPGTAIPWYAPGGGGTDGYLRGLDRVEQRHPVVGVRGHGSVLIGSDGVEEAVDRTRRRIVSRREAILANIGDEPVTFEALTGLIYPAVVHEVIPWASSVLATHLLELLSAGVVHGVDDGFVRAADQ